MINSNINTLDGVATNTCSSNSNHASSKNCGSATFKSTETRQNQEETVAIVGKRWRLNQPLQSCQSVPGSVIRNTVLPCNPDRNNSDYHPHYQPTLSNYMTSIASDDNSSIAFIDEDPPPYAVHCMSLPCPESLMNF